MSSGRRHFLRWSNSWVGTWNFLTLHWLTGTSLWLIVNVDKNIMQPFLYHTCTHCMWSVCSQVWSELCSERTSWPRRRMSWSSWRRLLALAHDTTAPVCWSRSHRVQWTGHPSLSAHTLARSLAHTDLSLPRSKEKLENILQKISNLYLTWSPFSSVSQSVTQFCFVTFRHSGNSFLWGMVFFPW